MGYYSSESVSNETLKNLRGYSKISRGSSAWESARLKTGLSPVQTRPSALNLFSEEKLHQKSFELPCILKHFEELFTDSAYFFGFFYKLVKGLSVDSQWRGVRDLNPRGHC
jgi:hypothetical protein